MHAVDYLVKPGEPERLEAAVERARTRIRRRDPFPREMATLAPQGASGAKRAGPERVSVRQGSRVRLLGVDDIDAGAAVAVLTDATRLFMSAAGLVRLQRLL